MPIYRPGWETGTKQKHFNRCKVCETEQTEDYTLSLFIFTYMYTFKMEQL